MKTSYSLYLLGAITVVFLFQIGFGNALTNAFILEPSKIASEPWRLVTSMFLHGGLMHVLFNGFALFMFGPLLEQRIGGKNFLIVFFAAGIIGALAYWATILLHIIPVIPALGASGGIFGILGALAVLYPEMIIYVFFFPMPMKFAAVFWFVFDFVGSFNGASGIGSAAHLGGLILGLLAGYYFKKMSKPVIHEEYEVIG